MARRRLRDTPSPEELAELYAEPHDHRALPESRLRAAVTAEVAWWAAQRAGASSAADLSCGSGSVLDSLSAMIPPGRRHYGDIAPGYPITGPVEETVGRIPGVDLFILAETLELLGDPGLVLKGVRERARVLVLSTPVGAQPGGDPGRCWEWDEGGVWEMLGEAGFRGTLVHAVVDFAPNLPHAFGVWAVR